MKPTLTAEDRRLLFTLLDAAADDGRLPPDSNLGQRWLGLRPKAIATSFHDIEPLYALLDEAERDGVLADSWIKERWLGIKARFEATRHPFGAVVK